MSLEFSGVSSVAKSILFINAIVTVKIIVFTTSSILLLTKTLCPAAITRKIRNTNGKNNVKQHKIINKFLSRFSES